MRRVGDLLATVVAPDRCLHCSEPARAAALLCDGCRRGLPWLPVDGCPRCGLPDRCALGRCPARRAPFAGAWAPLAYEGPGRTLAWANKQQAARRVSRWLGAAMVARRPVGLLDGASLVVPVPGNRVRMRRRGEDHARLLAETVGRGLGLPVTTALRVERGDGRLPQHEQGRSGRQAVPLPTVVRPVSGGVVLVDDVHTTGATLRSAARALRVAGADRVVALTAFRTLR